MDTEKVKFDAATREWFERNPGAQTTVMKCERCGLYFKPSLGHKTRDCKQDKMPREVFTPYYETKKRSE